MISQDEVRRIAHLAQLTLSEAEVELFTRELAAILAAAQRLQSIATDGIEPTAHATPQPAVLRPDEAVPSLDRDQVLANAPVVRRGCFQVPQIMEDEERGE